MKSFDLNIKSVEVKTTTRPIQVQWTTELAKDISYYHSLNIEKELSILLRKEIRIKKINQIFN
jgi:hypothetical protein